MLKIDLHIHSIHSGHAFGTLYDICAEAARKGMLAVGVSDHGPAVPGTLAPINFHMRKRAPRFMDGVRLLWGCEANVLNHDGELDIDEETRQGLDYVIAGLHDCYGFVDRGAAENTLAMTRAFALPEVKICAHPFALSYPIDHDSLFEAAIENGVLLEVNLSSLARRKSGIIESHRRMIDVVRSHGAKLIVDSDAHFLHEIGDDWILDECRDALGLDDEIMINNRPDELAAFLGVELGEPTPPNHTSKLSPSL